MSPTYRRKARHQMLQKQTLATIAITAIVEGDAMYDRRADTAFTVRKIERVSGAEVLAELVGGPVTVRPVGGDEIRIYTAPHGHLYGTYSTTEQVAAIIGSSR